MSEITISSLLFLIEQRWNLRKLWYKYKDKHFVHHVSSVENVAGLNNVLLFDKDKDEADSEGWKVMHFVYGYHEVKCIELLLEANLDTLCQHVENTPNALPREPRKIIMPRWMMNRTYFK